MIRDFRLPDLGEGLTESEIVSWKVAVGDAVKLNQIIAEVETAKAVVELPSPYTGVVKELREQPGTVVKVGEPIVSFEVEDDAGAPAPEPAAGAGAETAAGRETAAGSEAAGSGAVAAGGRQPILVGYGAEADRTGHPVRRARPGLAGTASRPAGGSGTQGGAQRPRSTPPVRKLARELGVDLEQVSGSGPLGLITREDIQEAAGRRQPEPHAVQPAHRHWNRAEREVRIPIHGVRKLTAEAMVASAFTAPHATEFLTVDVTPSMDLLERLRTSRAFAGIRITPLALVAKAVCIAVGRSPELNSRWDEANAEIVLQNYVNLGIAAATPRGLLVPNIKDAETKSLAQLALALEDLAEAARAGRTELAQLRGGTITITNVGVFGIDAGTPIINPGEAAILAMGAIRRIPWEHRGDIALRQVMTLSLSFDHRLVDGAQSAGFLADVGAMLSDPGTVLTMV
jgi:2-oxoisovalerate dehydrogenase E2 component (dihydrolipoyl transacylase)